MKPILMVIYMALNQFLTSLGNDYSEKPKGNLISNAGTGSGLGHQVPISEPRPGL